MSRFIVVQYVYFNNKNKKVSRANPAKVLAAAQRAYEDAWDFVTHPERHLKDGSGTSGAGAAESAWQEAWDATSQRPYWYNATTGGRGV